MRLGLGAKFTLTVLTILAGTMAANTLLFSRDIDSLPRRATGRTRPRARAPDFAGQPGCHIGLRFSAAQRLHPRGVFTTGCRLWRDRESAGRADKLLYQRLRSFDQEASRSGETERHTAAAAGTGRRGRIDPAGVSDHSQQCGAGAFSARYQPAIAAKRISPAIDHSDTGVDRHRSVSERGDPCGVSVQRPLSDPKADRRVGESRARPIRARGSEVFGRAGIARAGIQCHDRRSQAGAGQAASPGELRRPDRPAQPDDGSRSNQHGNQPRQAFR